MSREKQDSPEAASWKAPEDKSEQTGEGRQYERGIQESGSRERERELKASMKRQEEGLATLGKDSDGSIFEHNLNAAKKQLADNTEAMKGRLSKLSPEKRSALMENLNTLDSQIDLFEHDLSKPDLESNQREHMLQERNKLRHERTRLEKEHNL